MEFGETDLKSFLLSIQEKNSCIDMNHIRLLWQQMLRSVYTIHRANIIHTDLKPANFLFVRGTLKLIDFGIARTIAPDSTSVLRETQVGTLNYISPEALLDVNDGKGGHEIRVIILYSKLMTRYGDLVMSGLLGVFYIKWSMGKLHSKTSLFHRKSLRLRVILFQLIFQKSSLFFAIPFMYSNPWLMDVLMSCLQRNPSKRPSIGGQRGLLQHPFLQPHGEQAMLQFQAVTLGTENMQDMVKEILSSQDDSIWEKEDCIDAICKVVFYSSING